MSTAQKREADGDDDTELANQVDDAIAAPPIVPPRDEVTNQVNVHSFQPLPQIYLPRYNERFGFLILRGGNSLDFLSLLRWLKACQALPHYPESEYMVLAGADPNPSKMLSKSYPTWSDGLSD